MMDAYDGLLVIKKVLVVKYLEEKVLGKSNQWLFRRYSLYSKYGIKDGLSQEDVELINDGIRVILSEVEQLRLKHASECTTMEEFFQQTYSTMSQLREMVAMTNFIESYISIPAATFRTKIAKCIERDSGNVRYFKDKEIDEINNGIDAVLNILRNLTLSL
jgi:hypothetical protein